MPTVNSKDLVDRIVAADGYYMDDSRVLRITEYTTVDGATAYGLEYANQVDRHMYRPSQYVNNPRVYWEADRR